VVDAEHGLMPDLLRAMNRVLVADRFVTLGVYPFARSLQNVERGTADMHIPLLQNPNVPLDSLSYAYSTARFGVGHFVLYTNVAQPKINKTNTGDFRVYVQPAHQVFFPQAKGEMPVEGAFKRLEDGSLDGYICSLNLCDHYLRQIKSKGIKRQWIAGFDVKAAIPKGGKGQPVDRALSDAINKLERSGELRKILPPTPYTDW
jgi:hypothetical protein